MILIIFQLENTLLEIFSIENNQSSMKQMNKKNFVLKRISNGKKNVLKAVRSNVLCFSEIILIDQQKSLMLN